MKVAHLTTIDLSLRFLVLAQLRAVRDAGGEAIGISAPGPWVADLEREGIRHIALASSTRASSVAADQRSARELWQILRAERPTVLHTHNPKPGVYGRIVGRCARVPIIVNTVHGLYATPEDAWQKRALVYGLEAVAARCSDAELIQNPEDLRLMRRWKITRRDARLLGNGVDLDRFRPSRWSPADRAGVRADLGVGDERVLIGTVGRLVAEKGLPELFDAVATLDRDRYALVVVGSADPDKPDALDPQTVARAERLGVIFTGHRDDIDRLYGAMDVFVLASHREGFPRSAMEAAASGVPVIVTDVRGCRQVVDHGTTGLLVPVRDPAALASAIRHLGEDGALRAAFGHAGRRLAESRFDERAVVGIVLETYREVARRKGIAWDLADATVNARLRVLQVVASTDRRGAEVFAIELEDALVARGLEVRTVALAPGRVGGLDVAALGSRPLSPRTLRALRTRARDVDVVAAHGSTTLPACAISLVGTSIPWVYRNIGDPGYWSSTWLRRTRVRLALRRASAVVAIAAQSRDALVRDYGIPAARITVIPRAVEDSAFAPSTRASRRAARRALDLREDDRVVAFVGALSPEKNVGMAIDAMTSLPDVTLLVAGEGVERELLERRAASVAGDRVLFVGALADPRVAYAAADAVVLTSLTEGLPAVAIEAGLCALPVVTTDAGFVREIVLDGETGVVVPQGDRDALVAGIRIALDRGSELGLRARARCAERFSMAAASERWETTLRGVCSR